MKKQLEIIASGLVIFLGSGCLASIKTDNIEMYKRKINIDYEKEYPLVPLIEFRFDCKNYQKFDGREKDLSFRKYFFDSISL